MTGDVRLELAELRRRIEALEAARDQRWAPPVADLRPRVEHPRECMCSICQEIRESWARVVGGEDGG